VDDRYARAGTRSRRTDEVVSNTVLDTQDVGLRTGFSRRSRVSQIGVARRNSGEDLADYAASRINQLRKSSSAASHPPPRALHSGALRRDVSPKPVWAKADLTPHTPTSCGNRPVRRAIRLRARCILARYGEMSRRSPFGRRRTSRRTHQPVAEIVQCGEPISSFASIREHVERLNVGRRKTSAIERGVRHQRLDQTRLRRAPTPVQVDLHTPGADWPLTSLVP
jgi:hypothetical protein